MKSVVITYLFFCISFILKAQGLQEWINQKATQKKYLLQQIAALQIYIGYVEKGYSIAKKGLNTISNIKEGHFSLDKDFFAALKNVNPKVRNYAKAADIIQLNIFIIQQYKSITGSARQKGTLNNEELDYIKKVGTSLLTSCSEITDNLILLLTKDKLEMTDDERIKGIDQLYEDMRDHFIFINSFNTDVNVLSLQRNKELKDVNSLRFLYGQ